MSKGWDNIALKKLKALTGKGLSTSEIGKRLGMSKNAIVGKLNRLGWNAKATKEDDKKAATAKKGSVAKAETKAESVKKSVTKGTATKKTEAVKKDTVKTKSGDTVKKVAGTKVAEKNTKKTKTTEKVPAGTKVSAKVSAKNLAVHQRIVQHALEMANLKSNQCRWPIGDPDSEHFHFCGETVFVGKPYCYEHCKQAYQFAPPKKK